MPLLNKPLVSSANFQRTEQEIASLQKEVASQQQQTNASSVPAPSVPQPCTGGTFEGSHGFVIAAQIDKKGEFDTFCATIPAGCTRLGTLLGKFSDQGIRDNTIFHWVDVPDDIAASGGHFEYMFPLNLKYNTQYGLIQLIAVVEDPVTGLTGRKKNPLKPWNAQTQQYSYLDTWTTGNALNVPGTPNCATDIKDNSIYVDHDGGHAKVTLRAYYAANRTSTAAQMEVTKIGVRLKLADGTFIQASAVPPNDIDPFADITISDLPEGLQLTWQDVWTKHGTGRVFSAPGNCAITAGAVNIDPTMFATMVNGATIAFTAIDGKHAQALVTYTQPTTPFAIKKIQLLRSDSGAGGTYNVEVAADRPIAEGVTTAGAHSVTYLVKVKTASGSFWKVRMLARPGLDVTQTTGTPFTSSGDATGDAGPAGQVQNFTATWEAPNVTFKWKRPTSNANSITNYNVWATDPTGTVFMQILSDEVTKAGQLAPTQTKLASLVQSGHHITTKLKIKTLAGQFGGQGGGSPQNANFVVHVTANNVVNGVITEGTELTANVTPGVDYLDSNDAVNVTSAGQSVFSTRNELFNGHFHYARTGGACKYWSISRALGTWIPPVSSGTGLDFDVANHRLHWYGLGGGIPIQQLGDPSQQTTGYNVDAGDYKTVSFVLYSFNAQHTLSLQVAVRSGLGGAIAVVPFVATVNSTPTVYQVKFQIPPSQTFSAGDAFYLQFEDPGLDISNTSDLYLDVVGMNAGQRYTGYAINPSDSSGSTQAASQTWDGNPIATGVFTSPPVSPTGPPQGSFTQGGEPAVGFGGAPKFFQ